MSQDTMPLQPDVTRLLRRLEGESAKGRKAAYDELFDLVYQDLRVLARRQFARERNPVTLQPTALVHEAYGRLIHYDMNYENRAHFLSVAANAMRRVLIEQARSRNAGKRWGHQRRAPLEEHPVMMTLSEDPARLIDLDRAIQGLKPEQIQLVELRYFLELSLEETAVVMNVKPEALKKRWQVVKLLLYDKLQQACGDEASQ
jgi:RNA polymerase sigma factor (TIGR02999 family)